METDQQTPKIHLRDEWLPLLFLAACWGLAAWYWPHLPNRVPIHWGTDGRPNRWMDKPWGAIIGPLILTFVYALLVAIPFIDPRRLTWTQTLRVYPMLKNVMAALFLFITYLSLAAAASPDQHINKRALVIGMGLFFMVFGNYLPKVRSNFFVGVRTPWTLSSEVVWEKTHRVCGRLFVMGGAAMAMLVALPDSYWGTAFRFAMFGIPIAVVVFTLVYSWWLYHKLPEPKPPTRLE